MRGLDLTGQVFGELTVIEDSGQRAKDGSKIWRCKCSCGNENYLITSNELKREGKRARTHCNNTIHKINNLIGNFYGDLEVIDIDQDSIGSGKIKWWCKCHNCNRPDLISIRGNDLLMNKSHSCGCKCAISRGAKKIKNLLDENNYIYISEKTEENLINPKTNNKLRFDFYLFNYNNKEIYIEYDGEQHFYFSTGWNTKEKVIYTQYLDSIKNQWCLNNQKILYRVPYYDIDNINTFEDILQDKYLVKEINHYHLEPTEK